MRRAPGFPFAPYVPRTKGLPAPMDTPPIDQWKRRCWPNVCSHLPLGSSKRPAGLGFKQCSFHHTRLALTTRRMSGFLLRGRPHMLWSPSSFEGEGKWGVQRTFQQFSHQQVRSFSAAEAAHVDFYQVFISKIVPTPGALALLLPEDSSVSGACKGVCILPSCPIGQPSVVG